jgi:pyruvate/2-oxoglutarate dehydrogenase complex dihydrolipoamide dehydrogenase (E3) component
MTRLLQAETEIRPDLCVIGLDAAGFELAFAAQALGVPVALATACASPFAPPPGQPDPLRRLAALGARIIEGAVRFAGPDRLETPDGPVRARRFVIATGAEPALPPVPGLEAVPAHDPAAAAGTQLAVFGAGAHGVATAQAARRAGARVTLLATAGFLPGWDPDGAALVRTLLEREGVAIREGGVLEGASLVTGEDGARRLVFPDGAGPVTLSHAAFDCGLVPRLAALDPDKAGIAMRDGAPLLDSRLRTRNRRIHIAGAATGRAEAAGQARAEAAALLASLVFRRPGRIDPAALPRRVATRPALVEFGAGEAGLAPGARAGLRFLRVPVATASGPGFIKAVTTPKGAIRGAAILADEAEALAAPLLLAARSGTPLPALAELALPAPGPAGALQALGALFMRERLQRPGMARLIRLLRWLG